ncbi:hypothetical protein HPB50_026979 [Hyalomma asiaticum]|uniref:Uncharacterized protein n=1 Tax=Hyalomma asiaticum TaxID=266040 RepID=A0ACB7T625_HYAAI|nr:hypothetical protein HPB50_026979 [Hyalomma asiaticum]
MGSACISCKYLRKALLTRKSDVNRRKLKRTPFEKLRILREKNRRIKIKLLGLAEQLDEMRAKNATIEDDVLEKSIMRLPPKQQASKHRQCFKASKRASRKGMKYAQDWLLECILMKLKSPRLYDHIRKHEILVLPSKTTLKKYMKSYRSTFGFNMTAMNILKMKTSTMSEHQRHGGLLVDEIKLSEHLSVLSSGQIQGFVNLGEFTKPENKYQQCDHGMICLCLLWGSRARSSVTVRPVQEAFHLDSPDRTLKEMRGITEAHLNPNSFEKMRVSYAFQLFGTSVLRAMTFYKKQVESKCGKIVATEKFFEKINHLIKAMTSRFPAEALRPASTTSAVLENFLAYLNKWEASTIDKAGFVSDSTATGLRVTIASTLSLLKYLTESVGFKYLMTSHLSTDPIELMFGIIRQSGGCNAHPSPDQFLITVNCLSFHNMARSVDGANSTPEIISALLSVEDRASNITPKSVD